MPAVLPVTMITRPVWLGMVDAVSVAAGEGRNCGQMRRRAAMMGNVVAGGGRRGRIWIGIGIWARWEEETEGLYGLYGVCLAGKHGGEAQMRAQ